MNDNYEVAVAMSVYQSDNPLFFNEAMCSILNQKSIMPLLFIHVDGKVGQDLNSELERFSKLDNVIVTFHADNLGLAYRLNQSIDQAIEYGVDFLARMDADDISSPDRFITQVEFLKSNPSIDVVGSDVIEISEIGSELYYKEMDCEHDDMVKKIIKKCPFNHPSVMFRMSVFENGIRYNSCLMNTQDYYLWIDLLSDNRVFANINRPLLKFRINGNFHSRRGIKKAFNDVRSRLYALKVLNAYTLGNIVHTINLFLLRLAPSYLKKIAYKYLR